MPSELPHIIFGCGYLGRRAAKLWKSQGREVIVVTRSSERAEQFRRDGLLPCIADINQPQTLAQLPAADRVLWAVGFDRTPGQTQEQVFVDGLRNGLDHIGSRCRRFLYISSTSVYGQQDGSWVDESSPCEPTQPGGVCCLAGERLVQDRFSSMGSAVILRLAGIYGPERLLSRIADLKAGTPLAGSQAAWLNLIHVDDAASAVIASADAASPPNMVLVADDQPIQRGEYYARLAALVGAPPPRFDESQSPRRGSGGLNKRCSNRRLKAELGVTLRYPTIETGLPAALNAPT